MTPRGRRHGFTLVELMIAVMIAAVGITAAVNVARTLSRQTARGKQRTSAFSRSLLFGRQLRSDLRLAGIGSSGAVAVDPVFNGFGTLAFQTPGGAHFAISVVSGANDLVNVTLLGTIHIRDGSDALQLLVPNPASMGRTTELASVGSSQLQFTLDDAARLAQCTMVYLVDQSAPTGVGRSQIAFVSSVNAGTVTIDGGLQFSVARGTQVMCARLSTYWLDDQGYLRRTDLGRNPTLVRLSSSAPVYVDVGAVNAAAATRSDVILPGVLDLQIAYRVSSEAYRLAGAPVPVVASAQWAFAGGPFGQRADEVVAGAPSAWFETRLVRVNVLTRTLRKIDETESARDYLRLEDGASAAAPVISVPWNHTAEWTTVTESLSNLRYFDGSAPEGTPAEPF